MKEPASPPVDWSAWMRAFGEQHRRVRTFLGLSQDELARLAGVSQGAVSRLETGRGLSTPWAVVQKINLVFERALRPWMAFLSDGMRRTLEIEDRLNPWAGRGVPGVRATRDAALDELLRLHAGLGEAERKTFLFVMGVVAEALATGGPPTRARRSS